MVTILLVIYNSCLIHALMNICVSFGRFKAGFQHVLHCCVPTDTQEELELKSPRYLQTQVCVKLCTVMINIITVAL